MDNSDGDETNVYQNVTSTQNGTMKEVELQIMNGTKIKVGNDTKQQSMRTNNADDEMP